jgi:hypothetical protein
MCNISHPHTLAGLKRITLVKDPDKGIGCTIKCAAGHVFVNRIVEDGPIALTGVLRPGQWRHTRPAPPHQSLLNQNPLVCCGAALH